MDWHYSVEGKQQGPVSQDDLSSFIKEGKIGPSDLVWREGMPSWLPLSQVSELRGSFSPAAVTPYQAPQSAQGLNSQTASPFAAQMLPIWGPLIRQRKWLKFLGIMTLISGIFYSFYLVGIPLIFVGIWLMRAATLLQQMELSPHPSQAQAVNEELGKSFKLYGIYTLICLIIGILIFVAYFLFLFVFGGLAIFMAGMAEMQ